MTRRGRLVRRVITTLIALFLVYLATAGLWAYIVTPRVVMMASTPRVLDLRSLPDDAVDVLLPVEDPTFRKHHGIDPFARGQGRVTISRALVRMLYLERYDLPGVAGGFQRAFRLVNSIAGPADLGPDVMAVVVNKRLGKTLQLKLYLQHVYMGRHRDRQIYGFPDAARAYFGKEARQLSRREVVTLVAMIVGPNRFHPVLQSAALGERVRRIERLLRGACTPGGVRDVHYAGCAAKGR
ncbi:MAG: transglycosylase domain-containing protein [Gemmatimonadaceae bacterium]